MESNQEETKTLPVSEEKKINGKEFEDDLKIIRCIQTLFDNLPNIEKLLFNLDRLKEIKNLAEIKSIDLIKLLRGTQYSTTIEQFFEFDLAFKKLEEGFGKLQCSYPDCDFQAVMAFEGKDGEPTIQYCHDHFNHSNNSTESPKYFELELKLHKILFDELEIQLVYIQDRIDYIKSDKNQKNMNLYAKIDEEVKRNLDNIRSTLKTTTERIYQIDESYNTITKNKASMINYGDFSFVKKDLAE